MSSPANCLYPLPAPLSLTCTNTNMNMARDQQTTRAQQAISVPSHTLSLSPSPLINDASRKSRAITRPAAAWLPVVALQMLSRRLGRSLLGASPANQLQRTAFCYNAAVHGLALSKDGAGHVRQGVGRGNIPVRKHIEISLNRFPRYMFQSAYRLLLIRINGWLVCLLRLLVQLEVINTGSASLNLALYTIAERAESTFSRTLSINLRNQK
jgi:hypothetical protein